VLAVWPVAGQPVSRSPVAGRRSFDSGPAGLRSGERGGTDRRL